MRRVAGLGVALALAALAVPAAASTGAEGAGATLSGTVRGSEGGALAGAVVVVVPEGCGDCPETLEASSGDDGAWRVPEVAAGSYHLHVTDPSGTHADQWWGGHVTPVDPVAVSPGEQRAGLDFDLEPGAAVTGRVRAPSGEPLAGAVVGTARTPFSTVEATSDADGRFELRGLAGRTYEIEVSAGAAGLGGVSATAVLADGAELELEVALPLLGLQVVRVAGPDRVATSVAASREAFDSATAVVIASAGSFPDALAAAPLAAGLDGPLLLTGRRLPGPVAEEIRRLGATEAVIVGAVGAVPLIVQEEVRRLGLETQRVAGETRFDTAALLAPEVLARAAVRGDGENGDGGENGENGEAPAPVREVVLASGGAFPDALSVAPLAAAEGLPILLSASAGMVGDTAEVLAAVDPERVLVVGGEAAISRAVARELPAAQRLAGPERYATSVAVAEEFLRRGADLGVTYVATGADFPDALAAGPVAARTRGPVLLVDGMDATRSPATLEFLRAHGAGTAALWVFGGTAAVSDATVARLVQARGEP